MCMRFVFLLITQVIRRLRLSQRKDAWKTAEILRHQVAVMELLRDLVRRDGVTVLAVMHDIHLARMFFARMLLLDHGRLIGDGPPAEVLSDSNIRVVYGVDPSLVNGVAAV